jgi:hypothetical protein
MTNGEEPQPTAEISQKERLLGAVQLSAGQKRLHLPFVYMTGITDGAQD